MASCLAVEPLVASCMSLCLSVQAMMARSEEKGESKRTLDKFELCSCIFLRKIPLRFKFGLRNTTSSQLLVLKDMMVAEVFRALFLRISHVS